jgi:hypothetical protein
MVYVDDIILTGNHQPTIQCIVSKLQLDFALKDLGSLGYFLGIQATKDSAVLHLRQSKYILDLLDRIQMTESKPYPPCLTGSKCIDLMESLYTFLLPIDTLWEHSTMLPS